MPAGTLLPLEEDVKATSALLGRETWAYKSACMRMAVCTVMWANLLLLLLVHALGMS